MEFFFAELDCEQVRDILVVSRKKTAGNRCRRTACLYEPGRRVPV